MILLVFGREAQRTKGIEKVLAPKFDRDAMCEVYFGGWSFCNSSLIEI